MTGDPLPANPLGSAADGTFGSELDDERVVIKARRIRQGLRAVRTATVTGLVIFVLAALATPITPYTFQCRSKQSEAKTRLTGVYVAMMAHKAETGRFATAEMALASAREVHRAYRERYWITVDHVDDAHFVASAIGKPGSNVAGDLWQIDDQRDVKVLVNRCRP